MKGDISGQRSYCAAVYVQLQNSDGLDRPCKLLWLYRIVTLNIQKMYGIRAYCFKIEWVAGPRKVREFENKENQQRSVERQQNRAIFPAYFAKGFVKSTLTTGTYKLINQEIKAKEHTLKSQLTCTTTSIGDSWYFKRMISFCSIESDKCLAPQPILRQTDNNQETDSLSDKETVQNKQFPKLQDHTIFNADVSAVCHARPRMKSTAKCFDHVCKNFNNINVNAIII